MIKLIIGIAVYFIVALFGYFTHKWLHQPWSGRFNKSHMKHHLELYPSNDYESEKYRSAGKDSTFLFFAILSIPLLLMPIGMMVIGLISLFTCMFIVIEMIVIGLLNDYLHDIFHIKNHWLKKIPLLNLYINQLNKLHYIHHSDMTKNYGIFTFLLDKAFKTYSSK